jgi:hypothetical protein
MMILFQGRNHDFYFILFFIRTLLPTVQFMTPRQKNAMPVDCLQILLPKVQPKSTFSILLLHSLFFQVHPYRRMPDSDNIIDVDDDESDDESADGSNTPQKIRKRQEFYDKAM